jgi:hypothetical protein
MSDISTNDALDIFSLPYAFTMNELKTAYKRVSMAVHPDRGGSPDMFNTVNQCYHHLLHELSFRTGTASHFDLKRDSEHHYETAPNSSDPSIYTAPDRKFDISRFNEVYNNYKVEDEFSKGGYGDFLKKECAAPPLPKINLGKGGNVFETEFVKRVRPEERGAIVVRPAPLLDKGSLPFAEIGVDGVDDYGAHVGDIQAVDCKRAYSEDSMASEFHNYKDGGNVLGSMEQISKQRQRYFDDVWDEDAQRRYDAESKRIEEEKARKRREVMIKADTNAYQAHAMCNRKMLGYQ